MIDSRPGGHEGRKDTRMKTVWIVSYAFSGCMVHSEGFDSKEKAEEFYNKMKDLPYCEMYQTEDIWSK